ncbi:MAG: multicopper oxidase domain-containing protein [Ilumatobacter sp.]|nr:multicopper oxidase domain-containing protein [Ilumatobacter sp.]
MTTPTQESAPRDRLDRRRFIQAAGGAAAGLGLVACADDGPQFAGGAQVGTPAADPSGGATSSGSLTTQVDPRRDSIVPDLVRIADLSPAPADEPRMTIAPEVPAPVERSDQRVVEFGIEVIENVCEIDPANGVSTLVWGFRPAGETAITCGAPGPVMRARVGDLARITVTNLASNDHPHNIDFHAVTGQGGGAAGTTVAPGESATINARLLYPGAFMYHCAFGDVPEHIVHGMYGMFIVDPEDALPAVDHEWAIMQSEWYVGEPDADGVALFDRERLELEHPTYVTFNGRTDALTGDNTLQMAVGERARFFMVNEGLNLDANFHPIGSHWDLVYPEGATHPINTVIRGSQSTLVVAGGGSVCELVGYVPSTIVLVDHALVRTFYKGCIGLVEVTGDESPIFSTGDEGLAAAAAAEPEAAAEPIPENTVVMPDGAWDPANAETAYTPTEFTAPVGTTIVWRNDDTVFHTVTSGTASGSVGEPDGAFDSGRIEPGQEWAFTFTAAGTYDYFCVPHPWMVGSVTITE